MILYSKRLGRLVLEDAPFSSGGAGEVFKAKDASGKIFCVKKLTKPKPGDLIKIQHMVDNPPKTVSAGWGQLCWPLDLVGAGAKVSSPVGYVMPMAKAGSVELSHITNLRWPGKQPPPLAQKLDRSSPKGLTLRMYLACNITAAVHEIHRLGCVFVDLKPQNILVAPDGTVSMVDLDSLQVKVGGKVLHGPLGSPEYMPSESYRMNFNSGPEIDPSWDRFSLAVIIYEILLGIHPFTATVKPTVMDCDTIESSIRFKMYVHGNNRANLESIPPPHDGITALPKELVDLFKKTFDAVNPAQRPATQEWGEALKDAATGGGPVLSKKIYAPKQPPGSSKSRTQASTRTTAATVSQSVVGSEACFGPPHDRCPFESLGTLRFGVPNTSLPVTGQRVYLCPRCQGSHDNVSSSGRTTGSGRNRKIKCRGPWGGGCSQDQAGSPVFGYANYDSHVNGTRVFLCHDCYVALLSHVSPSVSPSHGCYTPPRVTPSAPAAGSSGGSSGEGGCANVFGTILGYLLLGFFFFSIIKSCK